MTFFRSIDRSFSLVYVCLAQLCVPGSSTTNTAEESIDEQYSTLLQDLFSFRKQDPNLFQTLMDSLHHHQGKTIV